MLKRTPLRDGTKGFRYQWGLTRKRSVKNRYGMTFGPTMIGTHFGKRSIYVERAAPVKFLHNFAG